MLKNLFWIILVFGLIAAVLAVPEANPYAGGHDGREGGDERGGGFERFWGYGREGGGNEG